MASISKLPSGRWQVRWRDASNRQRAKNFARKADAQAHAATADRSLTPDRLVVAKWADMWLDGARNLGPGGRATYRRDLDRHILPTFGDRPLDKLTSTAIDEWLAAELEAGVAPSSVHRHYRTVRRMMAVAVQRGVLVRNPCDAVTPPRVPVTEMRFLDVDEVERLAKVMPDRYRAWLLVAAWSGVRWSEGVGLRPQDVDGQRVTVTGQLVRRDGDWCREPPKTTAGRRTITLPASVADELAEHLAEYSTADLVFPNQHGRPMNGPSFRSNIWRQALDRAGVDPQLRVHDLRHTAVALAVAAGAHPKTIQARMGHASISITLDRYGHLFDSIDQSLAGDLDALRRLSTTSKAVPGSAD